MKKFSKILESKNNILSKAGISDSDISDIFIELVDIGYKYKTENIFISTTGHIYRNTNNIHKFYPCVLISLDIDNDEGDVRNWDGGIHYGDNVDILESIYNAIYRLKSTFGEKTKVYYSIDDTKRIRIRLVFDLVINSISINIEGINNIIKSLEILDNSMDRYKNFSNATVLEGGKVEGYCLLYENIWGQGQKLSYEGFLKLRGLSRKIKTYTTNIDTPRVSFEFAIKSCIDEGVYDNKDQIGKLFESYVKIIFNKSKGDNLLLKKSDYSYTFTESIDEYERDVVEISFNYEKVNSIPVITKMSTGLFSSNKTVAFDVYEISFNIKIL